MSASLPKGKAPALIKHLENTAGQNWQSQTVAHWKTNTALL